jgi:heme-degrading monooxygenase HmoA
MTAAAAGTDRPVRAVLTMTVAPGDEDRFVTAWRAVAAEVATWDGVLAQSLCRAADDDRTFVVTSDWLDLERFRAFETSGRQDELTAPLRRLRATASMRVHRIEAEYPPNPTTGTEEERR